MSKDIEIAIKIIEGTYNNTEPNYSDIYMWTTENIRGLINQINLTETKIFTVCSSGDHIFNFLLEGASDVVAFDINPLTEYIFHLKKAAIINLEYEEFIDFFFQKPLLSRKTFNKITYSKIRKDIPEGRFLEFWDKLFEKYPPKVLYNSKLFKKKCIDNKSLVYCNKYLNNQINYNILKQRLKTFEKLKFYKLNLFDELPTFEKKFDFVYLSNILDSWYFYNKIECLKKIKELIIKISKLINDEGLIGLCYLFFYLDGYRSNNNINNITSLVADGDIDKKEYPIISFRSGQNLKSTRTNDIDGVILSKKKRKIPKN